VVHLLLEEDAVVGVGEGLSVVIIEAMVERLEPLNISKYFRYVSVLNRT
jgi:hypothetical protein